MRSLHIAVIGVVLCLMAPRPSPAQQLSSFERQRGLTMLHVVREDLDRYYFDPGFGGVDLAAVFDTAEARIKAATRIEEVHAAIAQATLELHDSHTLFIPPTLVYRARYGWESRFVGDTCRV